MNKIYFIITLLLVLTSCEKKDTTPKEETRVQKDSIKETSLNQDNDDFDCIFDNKPKELTEEWLKNSGFEKFTWDEKNKRAVLVQGQDTLYVYKGGCNHMASSVEVRMRDIYENSFDEKLLEKLDSIACKFKFDNYCGKITTNQFNKTKSENDNSFILEFEDDNPEDNLILDGIRIQQINNSVQVVISEYYN